MTMTTYLYIYFTRSLNEVSKITLLLACIWALNFSNLHIHNTCISHILFLVNSIPFLHFLGFYSWFLHFLNIMLLLVISPLHLQLPISIQSAMFIQVMVQIQWLLLFHWMCLNYLSWSRSMRRELGANNKLSNFIDGVLYQLLIIL